MGEPEDVHRQLSTPTSRTTTNSRMAARWRLVHRRCRRRRRSCSSRRLQPTAVKTLGYYAQEQASLRDRLFVTVAARSDQNSAFGTKFQKVLYPKLSVSWIMSDEPFFPQFGWMNSFRLRTAYGANGVQPGATAALQTFSAATQTITKVDATTGTDLPGLIANNPGNANLKPETSAELESGFETDLFNHRMHIDYTYYKKNTKDALIALPIPSSVGSPVTSLQQNIGKTQNAGHELQINIGARRPSLVRLGRDPQRLAQRQQVG